MRFWATMVLHPRLYRYPQKAKTVKSIARPHPPQPQPTSRPLLCVSPMRQYTSSDKKAQPVTYQ